jgi:NAD(P)H-dependent flavin oxidoreductase YrpB (nitropropane dioxygenase family)
VQEKEQELEQKGASLEEILRELMPLIGGAQTMKVFRQGDLDSGVASCGQVVGSIDKILSVRDLIEGIAKGMDPVLQRLNSYQQQSHLIGLHLSTHWRT